MTIRKIKHYELGYSMMSFTNFHNFFIHSLDRVINFLRCLVEIIKENLKMVVSGSLFFKLLQLINNACNINYKQEVICLIFKKLF